MKNHSQWRSAATAGFILSLPTILVQLIQTLFTPNTAFNLILWVVKLAITLGILYYSIKEYSKDKESFSYKEGFHYGFLVSFFSSIICGCYLFLHYGAIFPNLFADQLAAIIDSLSSSNPEAVDSLEKIEAIFPQLIFAISIVYYTIIGVVTSSIIANYTKTKELF